MPDIDEESRVKLLSCLDEVRNIVGDSATDQDIVDTLMRLNFDMPATLDSILNATSSAAAASTTKKTPFTPAPTITGLVFNKGEYQLDN